SFVRGLHFPASITPINCSVFFGGGFAGSCSLARKQFEPGPSYKERWDSKRALFGVYDNIGILGDFRAHPRDLIIAPSWLKGWKGNELQRCIRKRQFVGGNMFYRDRQDLKKRINFLYRRFNRYGKHR
uniref:Large ribosomal subunit protein mL51 n=1 Tax=Leptobrachium leishanense TaxID=445787 RepID=A0A8C5PEX5_9ANUR